MLIVYVKVREDFIILLTCFIIELATLSSWLHYRAGYIIELVKTLSTVTLFYASLISSLLNKEPTHVILASNLEDISVSFLHVRALCLVLLQLLQRRRAS
jgi:hypothetical protein